MSIFNIVKNNTHVCVHVLLSIAKRDNLVPYRMTPVFGPRGPHSIVFIPWGLYIYTIINTGWCNSCFHAWSKSLPLLPAAHPTMPKLDHIRSWPKHSIGFGISSAILTLPPAIWLLPIMKSHTYHTFCSLPFVQSKTQKEDMICQYFWGMNSTGNKAKG